tara:strand:+ start:154 stop:1221 length:1068 start_codon:yes stop_codon:yes gene_type:complete
MVPFAGWEMPVQFSSLIEEHIAVRQHSGVFDISHMGLLILEGDKAKDGLQSLVPTDLYRIGPGESCYSVLLNENGGIIDDLIIYDLGLNKENKEILLIVVNASRTEKDTKWLQKNLQQKGISIKDFKGNHTFLAIQGPKTLEILEKITNHSLKTIPNFGHRRLQIENSALAGDANIFLSKTGYTGEEGFELLLPSQIASNFWDLLIKEGVKPCGLGARDTLRLEAAMHLYGNELDMTTSPLEAGLGWLVHLEMPCLFIGRDILEKQVKEGVKRRLVGIKLKNRAIARHGYKVLYENKPVGIITSGTWSPSLDEAIALAYVPTELSNIDTPLEIEIRGKQYQARTTKKPFYKRTGK